MTTARTSTMQHSGGNAVELAPPVRRIVAPNASAMTFRGTNTYLVGDEDIAIIDPGPDDNAHLARVEKELETSRRLVAILVTHSHLDHTGLTRTLAARTGAPVMAHTRTARYASGRMASQLGPIDIGGGEGLDRCFEPDIPLKDGQSVSCDEWSIRAVWTPGHTADHMCFELVDSGILFSGDHVMGWSTTVVSPPDGDMGDFMRSLARLLKRNDAAYYPGHGDPVTDPVVEVNRQLAHRRLREQQILEALKSGPHGTSALARQIYADLPDRMKAVAERNVLAHLLELTEKGRVQPVNRPDAQGLKFRLSNC